MSDKQNDLRDSGPPVRTTDGISGVVTAVQNFTIGIYSSSACHSFGRGPGGLYLGSRPAGVIDGESILIEGFALSLTARPPAFSRITATATDSNGNTSECSNFVIVT